MNKSIIQEMAESGEKKDEVKATEENSIQDASESEEKCGANDADSASNMTLKDAAANIPADTKEQIIATLYGQCMGDAIGLLSEFYSKEQAVELFGKIKYLEYETKSIVDDAHRSRWKTGDWTDDSDQMILIMQSLVDKNGEIDPLDFAKKLHKWMKEGFKELGDRGGMGIGATTAKILHHPKFLTDPHKAAEDVWTHSQKNIAPNGGVMRTSILGIHDWWDTLSVEKNAVAICKVTHRDPRCLASVVAVCVAISLMLQKKYFDGKNYDIKEIKAEAQRRALIHLQEEGFTKYAGEFQKYMK